MRRIDEVRNPLSCLNKAKDDELIFVLLARDPCAVETVRFWASTRVSKGINKPTDQKIAEALAWADKVEADWEEAERPAQVRVEGEPANKPVILRKLTPPPGTAVVTLTAEQAEGLEYALYAQDVTDVLIEAPATRLLIKINEDDSITGEGEFNP